MRTSLNQFQQPVRTSLSQSQPVSTTRRNWFELVIASEEPVWASPQTGSSWVLKLSQSGCHWRWLKTTLRQSQMVQTGCEQVPPGCWNWLWLGQTGSNWRFFLGVETGCDCLKVVVTGDGFNWTWLWLAQTGSSLAMTSSNQFLLVVETGCDWLKVVLNLAVESWFKLFLTVKDHGSNWLVKQVLPGCWNWLWLAQTGSNQFFQGVETGCELAQIGSSWFLTCCLNRLWLA